jgi:transcriptional regulator with XRE-family HTH domain
MSTDLREKPAKDDYQLTLMDVARRLKSKSPNAYARYEQGKSVPTVAKLDQLMKAIDPAFEPILKVA